MKTFDQVLDSFEALPADQQESLLSVLDKRMCERRRELLAKAVQDARKDFRAGKCRPASPAEIMRKVLA